MDASVSGYIEHLTDTDLRLLAGAAELPAGSDVTDPARLETLLANPRVFEAVFGPSGGMVLVSPFLAFGAAVHRAADDLDHPSRRSGPRRPGADSPELREFLRSAQRRFFLTELLASFTRFSELDPAGLAGLLDVVPDAERPGIYRRLGDVSLFLTGVFPGYSADRALGPVEASGLLGAARVPEPERDGLAAAPALDVLEYLGARWYRAALASAPARTASLNVVGEVAARFRQARRVLNHLATRYLTGPGASWFPRPNTS